MADEPRKRKRQPPGYGMTRDGSSPLGVRIGNDVRARLERIAAAEGRSVGSVARDVLTAGVSALDEREAP